MPRTPPLTAVELAQLEIDNGLRQYDAAIAVVHQFLEPDRPFRLRPSLIRQLQEIAVDGIEDRPGEWRTTPVRIEKSNHTPPEAHLVEGRVVELCDFVNDNWHEKTPFFLSAYVMWRLNWIHPFTDGNGRTSRIISYLILCVKLGYVLPGSPTIPQQIQKDRTEYFDALDHADRTESKGALDLSPMETMLRNMLANQLLSVIKSADGAGGGC
jgi:Fic family protein